MKKTTIKDIARELQLSTSTVSRALRGSWEISEETKQRVLNLAKNLDYTPDPVALSLQNSHSNDIGVIVPDISNAFFSGVIAGIEDVAFLNGYHVVIYQSHDDYEREVLNIKHIYNRRKDGLLVSLAANTQDFSHFKALHDKGFPMVFFDRIYNDIDTHTVSVDDYEGAYQATQHLIEQGCQSIAHISGPINLLISRRRLDGYRAALLHYNIPINEELIIEADYNFQAGVQATQQLLASPVKIDGLFAASDNIAIGCHSAISAAGLSMPEDIALIGFSDLPISNLLHPPLSTIEQPAFEMGCSAAELLISLIKNPKGKGHFIDKVIKTNLIIRKSSLRKS